MELPSLTPNTEKLLKEILEHRLQNGLGDVHYWKKRFDGLHFADDLQLRSQFKQLSDAHMIQTQWAADVPYMIVVLENGVSYFDQKKKQEDQKKEEKELADKEECRQRASAIVGSQPIVAGMRIMDSTAEDMLKGILSCYDGNEKRYVKGDTSVFPETCAFSLDVEFEKLYFYGVTSEAIINILGEWSVYLTPKGISYFTDKENAMKQGDKKLLNNSQRKQYDVFISHASKDKSDYVESLYMCLRRLGVSIFYDSDSISWGDNWKKAILDGTAASEFAIIVISEHFFDREWTERELNEFLKLQNESGQKIVLPLLHKISRDQLKAHYPKLEEIQVIDTATRTEEDITILFAKELIKRLR